MNRKIIIPTLNDGKEFEMPKRKPRHRKIFYEKMIELEKEKPEIFKDMRYRQLMEGACLALIIIQDVFPKATMDDILNLSDDINEENNILQITCIAWGSDFEELKKGIMSGSENFPKGKNPQNT